MWLSIVAALPSAAGSWLSSGLLALATPTGLVPSAVIEPDQYADLMLAGYALALIGCVQVALLAVIAVRLLSR